MRLICSTWSTYPSQKGFKQGLPLQVKNKKKSGKSFCDIKYCREGIYAIMYCQKEVLTDYMIRSGDTAMFPESETQQGLGKIFSHLAHTNFYHFIHSHTNLPHQLLPFCTLHDDFLHLVYSAKKRHCRCVIKFLHALN